MKTTLAASSGPRSQLSRLASGVSQNMTREGVIEAIVTRQDRPLPAQTWPTIALALVGFATPVVGFVKLADRVENDIRLPFDRPVMKWLERKQTPRTTRVMKSVTHLGGVYAVPAFALASAGYLVYFRNSRRPAALLTVSLVGSTTINSALKAIYKRSRPPFFDHIVHESSYSFPSGHAMASLALAACASVITWPTKWRAPTLLASSIYVPTIGVTRMYLGVHYPSDIIAGWCVSAAWVGEVATIMWVMDRIDIDTPLNDLVDLSR